MKRVREMISSVLSGILAVTLVLSFFHYYDNSSSLHQMRLLILVVLVTSLVLADDVNKYFKKLFINREVEY